MEEKQSGLNRLEEAAWDMGEKVSDLLKDYLAGNKLPEKVMHIVSMLTYLEQQTFHFHGCPDEFSGGRERYAIEVEGILKELTEYASWLALEIDGLNEKARSCLDSCPFYKRLGRDPFAQVSTKHLMGWWN